MFLFCTMTHLIHGNIFTYGDVYVSNKYRIRVNSEVVEFVRGQGAFGSIYKSISTEYFKIDRDTGSELRVQPFIRVFDEQRSLRLWKGHHFEGWKDGLESALLVLEVCSGSHVGVHDTFFAQEIYETTMGLAKRLSSLFSRRLQILFDDGNKLYLSEDFKKTIKPVRS